MKTQSKHNIKR